MIRYNKQIILNLRKSGDWQLSTDRGDIYEMLPYHSIGDWWSAQHQSDLRDWQKDIVIKMSADTFGKITMFNVFQKGRGYNQNHDICIAYCDRLKIWILSTADDYWIEKNPGGSVLFNVEDSLGSIQKQEHRKELYEIYDMLKQEYNPDNLCHYNVR